MYMLIWPNITNKCLIYFSAKTIMYVSNQSSLFSIHPSIHQSAFLTRYLIHDHQEVASQLTLSERQSSLSSNYLVIICKRLFCFTEQYLTYIYVSRFFNELQEAELSLSYWTKKVCLLPNVCNILLLNSCLGSVGSERDSKAQMHPEEGSSPFHRLMSHFILNSFTCSERNLRYLRLPYSFLHL